MTLTIIVEKTSSNWGAFAPDLRDNVIATGDTREEAIKDFRDALLDLFDDKREQGQTPPDVTDLEIRETLPLAPAAPPDAPGPFADGQEWLFRPAGQLSGGPS